MGTHTNMKWKLIAGLGNSGARYRHTYHNVGALALEAVEKNFEELGLSKTPYLLKPQDFMNDSGGSIQEALKKYCLKPEDLLVIHDDSDIPLGKYKYSFGKNSGGHKGIESVARALKTKKFWRVRIGVSASTASGVIRKPQGEKEVLKFILDPFKPHEHAQLKQVFKRTSHALETIVLEGPGKAMNQFN